MLRGQEDEALQVNRAMQALMHAEAARETQQRLLGQQVGCCARLGWGDNGITDMAGHMFIDFLINIFSSTIIKMFIFCASLKYPSIESRFFPLKYNRFQRTQAGHVVTCYGNRLGWTDPGGLWPCATRSPQCYGPAAASAADAALDSEYASLAASICNETIASTGATLQKPEGIPTTKACDGSAGRVAVCSTHIVPKHTYTYILNQLKLKEI